jgi:hypothetical protein
VPTLRLQVTGVSVTSSSPSQGWWLWVRLLAEERHVAIAGCGDVGSQPEDVEPALRYPEIVCRGARELVSP